MKPIDLSSCSRVCREWKDLVSAVRMVQRRDLLNPYKKVIFKYQFGSHGYERGELYLPRGICAYKDTILICDSFNDRVQAFTEDGQSLSIFGPPDKGMGQFGKPWGICNLGETALVSYPANERICVLDPIKLVRTIDIPNEFKPYDICITPKGLIVVSTWCAHVLILDQSGDIIRIINPFGPDNGKTIGSAGICCNSKGEILIVVGDRILFFSEQGQFLHALGSQGNGPNQFCNPRGICVDWEDNIFVADSGNDRISIFTSCGLPLQQIHFTEPNTLCVTNKKIFVTTSNSSVGVFSN